MVLSKTAVPPGSLWFLKGAARVHTVMALVVYLVKHTNCTLQVRGVGQKVFLANSHVVNVGSMH